MLGSDISAPFSSSVSPDGGVMAIFSAFKDYNTYGVNAFITDYENGTFQSCTIENLSMRDEW